MNRARPLAALEIIAFYGFIFLVIWVGQKLPFRPPLIFAALALLGTCYLSNRKHGDSRERLGLDHRHLKPCAQWIVKILAVPLLVMVVLALRQPAPSLPKIIFGVIGYPLWAFAQEYALLSFSANRLSDAVGPRPWTVSLVNGALFGLVHTPNPVLMALSFIGGIIFTRIFQTAPHLFPIALAHAAAGFFTSIICQGSYNAMMVGPAFLKHLGVPGPPP